MNRKQKGFSLIELLIVVAIILIIAAIAIPNLLRARMAANEASAVGTMRTITTAEVTYSTTYGTGFGTLASLGGAAATCATATGATSAAACLVDASVAGGTKSGYTIAIPVPAALGTTAAPNNTFYATAVPASAGQTGTSTFCTDQSGVVRKDPTGGAIASAAACSGLNPLQ
jgi:type IV pilus assembly protein PilA